MYIAGVIISIVGFIMFIVIFVMVIKLWNFQQEILRTGGYPTVLLYRAKRDAKEILAGRAAWNLELQEILEILSGYPADQEAKKLLEDLSVKKTE